MDLGLQGKAALVTGGSRGIGRAIARHLAREGAVVAICGRDGNAVSEAAKDLSQETGGRVIGFRADTGSLDDVRSLVAEAAEAMGSIDILVNNAARVGGTGGPDTLAELNEPMILEDVNVKVLGYLRCAREVFPLMERNRWGRIINIDGMAARNAAGVSGGLRNAAVMNFTKVLSEELGPKGITVNAVHPGMTRTEALTSRLAETARREGIAPEEAEARLAQRNAARRIIDADEIGAVVAFLCSEQAAAITGEGIAVDGGSSRAVFM